MSLVSVLKRIPNEIKRLEAQNKREWMLSNPLSLKIIDTIYKKRCDKPDAPPPPPNQTNSEGPSTNWKRHIVKKDLSERQRDDKKVSRVHMRKSLSASQRWKKEKSCPDT